MAVAATAPVDPRSIGGVAENMLSSFGPLARLITAGAYIAGLGFGVSALLKFKAHKDNPQQIPIGTPIALVFISAVLVFLPSFYSMTGRTLFGDTAEVAGISGITVISSS